MWEQLNAQLFVNLVIITCMFLMTRYVFLEHGMEEKKQRVYYIVSYLVIVLAFLLTRHNKTAALLTSEAAYLLLAGLNISLARKERKVSGFFLVIPLAGIADGILAPCILVSALPLKDEVRESLLLAIYLTFAILLVVFYFKGKKWRMWFRENLGKRRPLTSEYIMLWVCGIVILCASGYASQAARYWKYASPEIEGYLINVIVFFQGISFLLALTVIVLIMQGNRRMFYHDRVSDMQFSVISTMADIVENRDSNTGGHIKRTAKYVEIIARRLKKQSAFSEFLTDQYISDMIVAAPLHDIGKISIPDAILNKPGKLTDEEFAVMKTHTTAGRDILLKAEGQLGEFDYLEVALDMAESHHEWWNGNGYPNGISGEEIPLCARIMAVADVFDALTSKRCYKDAMPLERAFSIIREETGTHFDPVVAEAFLNSRQEIKSAFEEIPAEE